MKTNPKSFLRNASSKLNFPQTISDLKDGNNTISDKCQKSKAFNMFFAIVFRKETDMVRILLIRSPLLSVS